MYKLKNIILILTLLFISGCSIPEFQYKHEIKSTNYDEIISKLLKKASNQIFPNIQRDEILLVSNFADNFTLKSDTKLSFVLTDLLKDKLVSQYRYTIREIELSKNFKFGEEGFKVLTRDVKYINNSITKARYAIVGTYTITKNQLLLFLKMIDIRSGDIVASSNHSTRLTQEITHLNKSNNELNPIVHQPMVL
ncbi:MAG: FlgO family outer membrane protein [Campylobacterota bacterium]|nr:FlgO family outer membrane protein [Campylobacterota bacterium]